MDKDAVDEESRSQDDEADDEKADGEEVADEEMWVRKLWMKKLWMKMLEFLLPSLILKRMRLGGGGQFTHFWHRWRAINCPHSITMSKIKYCQGPPFNPNQVSLEGRQKSGTSSPLVWILRGALALYPILTLRTMLTRGTMVTVLNMLNVNVIQTIMTI